MATAVLKIWFENFIDSIENNFAVSFLLRIFAVVFYSLTRILGLMLKKRPEILVSC